MGEVGDHPNRKKVRPGSGGVYSGEGGFSRIGGLAWKQSPGIVEKDGLVSVRPVLDRWPNFRDLLLQDYDEAFTSLRKAEGIGGRWAQRTS
jgi:hypothetical protein